MRGWAGEGRWAARGGRGKRKKRAAAGLRDGREEGGEGDCGPGCRGKKREEGEWPAGLGPKEKRERKKETNKQKAFEFEI
jgi:hypothetical protein